MHVVVISAGPDTATRLAARLRPHVASITVGRSLQEAREAILRKRSASLVVDLETLRLAEVQEFCREFRDTSVVCTHRLADEQMWAASLSAGASDCCYGEDVEGILKAAGLIQKSRSTAA